MLVTHHEEHEEDFMIFMTFMVGASTTIIDCATPLFRPQDDERIGARCLTRGQVHGKRHRGQQQAAG